MKTESKIQQEIFVWFWNNHCLSTCEPREIMFHVPNENQHRLQNIGVVSGVSDLVMSWRGESIYCEVKTPEGKQSPNQIKFEKHIAKVKNSHYIVVRSLEEFKEIVLGS